MPVHMYSFYNVCCIIIQIRFFLLWSLLFVFHFSCCCRCCAGALIIVFFLPFHPSVLKPDFDLPLCEAQGMSDLNPPPTRQIAAEVELFLELQCLVPSVSLSPTLSITTWSSHPRIHLEMSFTSGVEGSRIRSFAIGFARLIVQNRNVLVEGVAVEVVGFWA